MKEKVKFFATSAWGSDEATEASESFTPSFAELAKAPNQTAVAGPE